MRYLFYKFMNYFSSKEVEVEVVVEKRITLTPEQFKVLQSKLPNCVVTSSDSAEVVAHKLGVQLALNTLRDGYVA